MDNKKLLPMVVIILLFPFIALAKYKVFFIPLNVETYTPITIDEIEAKAHVKYQLKESAELDKIYLSLKDESKSLSKFDTNQYNVRAKFIRTTDNKAIYLDKAQKLFTMREELNNENEVENLVKSLNKKFEELCKSKKVGKGEVIKNCP